MAEIIVSSPQPYPVVIEPTALRLLPEYLGGAGQVALVYPSVLAGTAAVAQVALQDSKIRVLPLVVPEGETAKTAQVLTALWSALAKANFTRTDLVIGVGGGATTDVAGFLAASYLRGIPWIAVPTTVLGAVDASVGGKTAIDLPEGKNLVGAFHDPRAVLIDFDLLRSLPPREIRSGLAEVAKTGFIADAAILKLILDDPVSSQQVTSERFAELVTRAVQVKAATVAADPEERILATGSVGREQLNYGHTVGHAIEAYEQFRWRHGEAIAVGMVYAAELAARTTGLAPETVALHRSVLRALELPISYAAAPYAAIRDFISRDKKTRGGTPRFVLLDKPQHPIITTPTEEAMSAAYQKLRNDIL
ncbi:MAG: 3-dehydroquinate synthase [Propionibacteriaceae bacterium]|jgi:3-dehydroquinate synthase/shikimate kinase/3-dehydroquinate synthase|nr:3-dehydroquinate synthase [Propionibacteriaceae bacterium]